MFSLMHIRFYEIKYFVSWSIIIYLTLISLHIYTLTRSRFNKTTLFKLHVTSNDWRFFIQNKNNIGAIKLIIEVSKNFYDKISRDLSYEIKNIEMGETLKCINNCFLNLNSSIEKKTIKCDCK